VIFSEIVLQRCARQNYSPPGLDLRNGEYASHHRRLRHYYDGGITAPIITFIIVVVVIIMVTIFTSKVEEHHLREGDSGSRSTVPHTVPLVQHNQVRPSKQVILKSILLARRPVVSRHVLKHFESYHENASLWQSNPDGSVGSPNPLSLPGAENRSAVGCSFTLARLHGEYLDVIIPFLAVLSRAKCEGK
jgi:hypothetical protein